MNNHHCGLCEVGAKEILRHEERDFLRCDSCGSIMLSPENYLSARQEEERYKLHSSDIREPGYRKSVTPLVEAVEKDLRPPASGLDYGAGESRVAAVLLNEKGFDMSAYDPIFADDNKLLKQKYDFIVCNEVIEHFKEPAKEFKRLYSLLKPGGRLYCQTQIYSQDIDFSKWWYKNDPTHVFFYTRKSFEWIRDNIGYSSLEITGNVVKITSPSPSS